MITQNDWIAEPKEKKKKKDKRNKQIQIRLTKSELKSLQQFAELRRMSVSELVRASLSDILTLVKEKD